MNLLTRLKRLHQLLYVARGHSYLLAQYEQVAEAEIAIAPLRIGSGTRLKILEAPAMRKAVVSTSIGCEGLAVEPEKHLLVAYSTPTFTQAVIALLQNRVRRVALGNAGRALVETIYSWKECGNRLLHVLD